MKRTCLWRSRIITTSMVLILPSFAQAEDVSMVQESVAKPVLKWKLGGCTSYCERGWYSSPAVADLDRNGQPEVIGSGYAIHVLNGTDGSLVWRVKSGYDRSDGENVASVGRTWAGIGVADIDGDGEPEIATAHGGGWVSVYDSQGYFEPGWPKQPVDSELRGLSISNLDSDGSMEVIVTSAVGSQINTWVYEHNGTLRAGWPQLDNASGIARGVYNDNAAVGDLDGDGSGEIVVPSDVHYVCAYEANGVQIPANAIYSGADWGGVGVWEDLEPEVRGWGACDGIRSESYRANFANGPSAITDLDGNGTNEVVTIGNMYDCSIDPYQSKYNAAFIFNADRSRFKTASADWESIPVDTGPPLSEDYNEIENNQPNPVVVDLDGDGEREILFSSYGGHVHAFWLDKTQHGNWPYEVDESATKGYYRFASEPTVADLENDGKAEVIFASWVEKGSNQTGRLHIVDYLGNKLHEVNLPVASGFDWNGALAAPTLANIDTDADLEVVLNTAHSGLVAYDLPGTANARILWGTGRGSYQRDAYVVTTRSCQHDPVILEPTNYSGTEIHSSETSLTTSGSTVVGVGADITFEASDSISLDSGFQVVAGGAFTANIVPVTCSVP